jgi:hypothetical protein
MIGIEPIDPGFEKALLPADDRGSSGLQPAFDGVEGSSFRQHQDKPSAKDVAGWQGTRLSDAAQFPTLGRGKREFTACCHTSLEA